MIGKFELYKDANREWRWRLKADNGEIIANSAADGFKNYTDMKHSIDLVKSVNEDTPCEVVPSDA
jgi:uncharacterized protein YegP (UPF0339 family)